MEELVCRMLRGGLRPFEIATRLSLSYDLVQKICRDSGIPYSGRHLTDSEKREIRRLRELEGLPIRTIAGKVGRSKTVVGLVVRRRFLAVQDQGGKQIRPEFLKVPRRCPRHGLVRLWPCVACQADPD